jgi:acetyl-CoA/propionyl-CoA carboxylase carboxyl transferase subunit
MTATVTPAARLSVEVDPRDPVLRLQAFADEDSIELLREPDDSGMVAATVRVDGTPAVVFCSDARVMGGAMGEAGCKVVLLAYERALADGVPVVGLWHSGGARLAEGVVSLHAVGEVFAVMTRASGRSPRSASSSAPRPAVPPTGPR